MATKNATFSSPDEDKVSAKQRRTAAIMQRRFLWKQNPKNYRQHNFNATREEQFNTQFQSHYPTLGKCATDFVCPSCHSESPFNTSVNKCCVEAFLSKNILAASDASVFGSTDRTHCPFEAPLLGDLTSWVLDVYAFLPGPEIMDVPGFRKELAYRIRTSFVYQLACFCKNRSHALLLAIQALDNKIAPQIFRATGPITEEPEPTAWYQRLLSCIKTKTSAATDSVADVVKAVLNAMVDFVGVTLSMLSELFSKVLTKIQSVILNAMVSIFAPITNLKKLAEGTLDRIIRMIFITIALSFCVFGVLSFSLGYMVAKSMAGQLNPERADFRATGGTEVTSIVLALCSMMVGGFSAVTEKNLVQKMKNLTALVAGGVIITKVGLYLFYLLPTMIQHTLIRKFGTSAQISELDLEDWMPQATGLLKVSAIPEVLSSALYYDLVKEIVDKGSALVKNVPADRKPSFTMLHFQLLKVLATLTRFKTESGERTVPFAFHISGKPGVGKSVIAPNLIREVFGYDTKDVYYRPIDSEFWNAYNGQPVIVYDEFLIGGAADPTNMGIAKEYLALVSSSKFQPPLASVDQPTVGIKGMSARPKVVITMNNNPYDNVPGIDVDALQRRRQFVLEIRLRQGARTKAGATNNIDLAAYPREDLLTFPWCCFRVIDAQFYNGYHNLHTGAWYDYQQLIAAVQTQFVEHEEIQQTLMSAMARDVSPLDVRAIIEKELKNNYRIPTEDSESHTWMEYFTTLIGSQTFGATGNKKRPTQNKTTYRNTHKTAPIDKGAGFSVTRVQDGIILVKNPQNKWMLPGGMRNPGENFDTCITRETFEEAGLIVIPLRTLHIEEKPGFTCVLKHCTALVSTLQEVEETFQTRTTPEETIEIGIGRFNEDGKIEVLTPSTVESNPTFRRGTYNHLIAGLQDRKICGDFFCERTTNGQCDPTNHVATLEVANKPVIKTPTTNSDFDSAEEFFDATPALPPKTITKTPQASEFVFLGPQNFSLTRTTCGATPNTSGKMVGKGLGGEPGDIPPVTPDTAPPQRKTRPANLIMPTHEMLEKKIPGFKKPERFIPLTPDHRVRDIMLNHQHVTLTEPHRQLREPVLHRHHCLNKDIGCDNQLVFRELDHEQKFCNSCLINKCYTYDKVHWLKENNFDPNQQEIIRQPDETDEQFVARAKEAFGKLAHGVSTRFDIVFNNIISRDHTVPAYADSTFLAFCKRCLKDCVGNFFKGFCIGFLYTLLILIVSTLVKKYILGKKEEEVSELFTATSEQSSKSSRNQEHRPKGKGFVRSDKANWRARGSEIEMIGISTPRRPDGMHCAVPVKDKWILMHGHTADSIFVDGTTIILQYKGQQIEEIVDRGALFEDKENDLIIYEIQTKKFPSFPNNFPKFVTEMEIADKKAFTVRIKAHGSTNYASGHITGPSKYECGSDIITIPRAVMTNYLSIEGDCGNYCMITNGPLAGKIIGVIVAGALDGTSRSLVSIVTKDMLKKVIDPEPEELDQIETSFVASGCAISGPNIIQVEKVRRREQVHLPIKTGLMPSALVPFLDFPVEKAPAILSSKDERAQGQDPVVKGLNNLGLNEQHPVDPEKLHTIAEDILQVYQDNLFEWSDRLLTVEEAIGGVPGLLASLKPDTSPGIPHVSFTSKKGKKDYFNFSGGELFIEPGFKTLVQERVEEFQRGEVPEHIWAGYLKDELVSEAKIEECRTRIIYCGEVVSLVALRVLFGSTILKINNSTQTPSAIGINQYSYDMDGIFDYLTELGCSKFIAGDYKKFDQCVQEQFLSEAYWILGKLTPHVKPEALKAVYEHQVKSPLQMGEYKVTTICDQKSGSLFTSIGNNLVNEMYMRYTFDKICPSLSYDRCVRGKFLGDDHVLGVIDDIPFNGLTIQKEMAKIGQTYTSSEKTRPLEEYVRFEETTFLGAHPRVIEGRWTGALRKSTLHQAPLWTKDYNSTIEQTCRSMVELCSQWDIDFFNEYYGAIKRSLKLALGIDFKVDPFHQLRKEVASRTTASGKYNRFAARGFQKAQELVTVMGKVTTNKQLPGPPEHNQGRLAIKENMDIQDGTETSIYRETLTWESTQIEGTTLFNKSAPFGLLGLGEQDNIQNMPFDRFIYWRGDVEVTLHLTGTQFQCGCLILYFVPLSTDTNAEVSGFERTATALPHVFIQPGNSSTATLRVPFRFFRTRLNTFAKLEENERIGNFVIKVVEPLTDPTGTSVSVSLFTRFPDSRFTIPRPIAATSERVEFKATGNHSSTNYWIGSMMGRNSFEGSKQTGMNTTLSASASASQNNRLNGAAAGGVMVDLDKPIVGGGAMPTASKFPSFANTEGMEFTNVLSTKPNDMSLSHFNLVDPAETSIELLCNRPTLWKKLAVKSASLPGTELASFAMNSASMNTKLGNTSHPIPFCLNIINMFCFWRADWVLNFVAFKTPFHSFRLKVVVGYGAPSVPAQDNTYFTAILDFSGDSREHSVVIPYNQVLEYMASYTGTGQIDLNQNCSLGTCSIKLMNKLVAPASVAQDINVGVYLSLQNVKVAHPRPFSFMDIPGDGDWPLETIVTPPPTAPPAFRATGVVDDSDQQGDGPVQDSQTVPIAGTPSEEKVTNCETRIHEKFMHPIGDMVELLRRPIRLDTTDYAYRQGYSFKKFDNVTGGEVWGFQPGLWGIPGLLYKGWAGSFTLRIFSGSTKPMRCTWVPNVSRLAEMDLGFFSMHSGLAATNVPFANGTFATLQVRANSSGGKIQGWFNPALDEGYPIGDRHWTTVTIPFTTNVDFFCTESGWTPCPGTLLIYRETDDQAEMEIYLSAADDLRLIGLYPEPALRFGLNTGGSATTFKKSVSIFGWHDAL